MPKRVVRRLHSTFQAPAVRYPPDPRALFILALCVVSGLPLLIAGAVPGSIESQLDPFWVIVWGLMLTVGSLLSLVGMAWQSPTGVVTEQVGSVALGVACVVYAAAIWGATEWSGSVPEGIIIGLGGASFWRWWQLQRYLIDTERLASRVRGEE